ncbi:MAG: chromosomal replication initiator protein DnaA [Coriobacteriaceae bacterium]|nr:chromosomal replication initiator protein DnaA [Coriobacteriaceae bacterium]
MVVLYPRRRRPAGCGAGRQGSARESWCIRMQELDTQETRLPEAERFWTDALAVARTELNTATFNTWFVSLGPVSLDGETLVVLAPHEFAREWIAGRYASLVRDALRQVSGRPLEVRFVVDHDAAPVELPEPEPSEAPAADVAVAASSGEETPRVRGGEFDPGKTFDTFVVGESNKLAYHTALAVAESPGRMYNPLFIYGGSGLGKTHLLQAIGQYVLSHYPHLRVRYVSSENFTNDFIDSIRSGGREGFRQRYRANDVLLVDDIQFIAGKEGTQEEFFHTFNALEQAGKQIVLTSDRPPSDLVTLEERLRTRFSMGLPADIQPPDLETRIAIVKRIAEVEDLTVPDDVLEFVADRVSSNVRELRGALTLVVSHCSVFHKVVDLDVARLVLKDTFPERTLRPVSVGTIQSEVCRLYSVSRADLIGSKRSQSIVFPRQVAMYLARELTDLSFPAIGSEFGGRDHTTVMHATDKIRNLMRNQRDVYDQVQTLTNTIRQKS